MTIPPVFYHSEAHLPYFHQKTETILELITDENVKSSFQFGVISAKDNDTLSYILLAPGKQINYVNNLVDVDLSSSVPLLPKQVNEFIGLLNTVADKWNTKLESKNGISYEFLVSPRLNTFQNKQDSVYTIFTILEFYYQNNKNGSLASLLLGEGRFKYFYRFESLLEIEDLIKLLKLALNKRL